MDTCSHLTPIPPNSRHLSRNRKFDSTYRFKGYRGCNTMTFCPNVSQSVHAVTGHVDNRRYISYRNNAFPSRDRNDIHLLFPLRRLHTIDNIYGSDELTPRFFICRWNGLIIVFCRSSSRLRRPSSHACVHSSRDSISKCVSNLDDSFFRSYQPASGSRGTRILIVDPPWITRVSLSKCLTFKKFSK